jgi:FAD-dependent sensor of blue light
VGQDRHALALTRRAVRPIPLLVIQLIYTSKVVTPLAPDALRALLVRSRANNARLGVTGMLLHLDGSYLQVLEGKSAMVHALFARIRADRRHAHIITLMVRDLEERNFGDWSMAFFDGSGRAATMPGYRATAGFADLADDPATLLKIVGDFGGGRWRSLAA